MRFLAPYPPHPGLPTLLLLILLATGVWGAECELEACSEAYMSDKQGILEGPTIEYCSLVYRYIQCTAEYRSVCRGTIHYHSIQQMLNTFQTRNNCSEVLSGGVVPVIPDDMEEPETSEGEGCRYRGSLAPALCGLFGDPHLKTFDGQYMTCRVRGAWPLLNTPFLAIQVTNEAVGPDNTATATTKPRYERYFNKILILNDNGFNNFNNCDDNDFNNFNNCDDNDFNNFNNVDDNDFNNFNNSDDNDFNKFNDFNDNDSNDFDDNSYVPFTY
ncbi:repulsive guidance molecule B-like [Palaemon carinicauda]|uniref:repulsive guidance molecule B-like n=1 Tax=Palaemon carinicauda TaxID=392227 RepID=UPI0035B698BA